MKRITSGELYAFLCLVIGFPLANVRPLYILQNDTGKEFSRMLFVIAIPNENVILTHILVPMMIPTRSAVISLNQFKIADEHAGKNSRRFLSTVSTALIVGFDIEYFGGSSDG